MADYTLDSLLFNIDGKEYYRAGDFMVALYPGGTQKARVMLEAFNHAHAEELGIFVPPLVEVVEIGDRWALVTEYVGGHLLSDITKGSGIDDTSLEGFVDLAISVHQRKTQELQKLRDVTHRLISDSGLDGGLRYKLHTALDELPKHNKVCHGRLLPSRAIVGDNGKLYLIDWQYATSGNASHDAAYTYLSMILDCGTELAERFLTVFCRRADIARDYVLRWVPIVGASMLISRSEEGKEILKKYIK